MLFFNLMMMSCASTMMIAALRAAIYLRRSKGEKGNTKAQFNRIKARIDELVKDGIIAPVDFKVQGYDLDGKRRKVLFNGGDIWNEGNRKSAFSVLSDREVITELFDEMAKGKYDVVYAESLDRFTRDPIEIGRSKMLELYRDKGKSFLSLTSNEGFTPDDLLGESVAITSLLWSGYAKRQEIAKGQAARIGSSLDKGYLLGPKPEFIGSGTKGAGLDYRKAWKLMEAYGETEKGRLKSPSAIALAIGKVNADGSGDNKWASTWYARFRDWNKLGVLDDWLTMVEQMNQWIENQPDRYAAITFKSNKRWQRLFKASRGFIGYPAGVHVAGTDEFVLFPNPVEIGLDILADVEDPLTIQSFKVNRVKVGSKKLLSAQTQPRGKK